MPFLSVILRMLPAKIRPMRRGFSQPDQGIRAPRHRGRGRMGLLLMALLGTFFMSRLAVAAELTFSVFPILSEQSTRTAYAPLVDYLNRATGQKFTLVTHVNWMSYWESMKHHHYDLMLDGPHLTDYRLEKMGYVVVAKYPGVASYTLATRPDVQVFDTSELIGKTIATPPSPSMGAIQIYKLFPNPLRQPLTLSTPDSEQAAEKTMAKQADAAIVPTPMLARFRELTPVYTTEQFPAPAFTVRGDLPAQLRESIRKALLDIGKSKDGKAALKAMNIPNLEPAKASEFKGYMDLLQGMWGY